MEITPEMQAVIDEKINEAKTALQDEKERINAHAKKVLDEKKTIEARLKEFDGVDLDEINALKKALHDRDEEDLLKGGKLDELVAKRMETSRLDYEQKIQERDAKINELDEKSHTLESKFDNYRIKDALIKEARDAKVLDSAYEDLVLRAQGIFTIDEEGNIFSRDKEGNIRTTEEHKPITPKEFVRSLKKSAPHLWPSSEGANLRGSGDDGTLFGQGSSADAAARSGNMKSYRKARAAARKG